MLVPATIATIRANQPSFRDIKLKPGFNVIVAERTKESTRKDSRNGLGKSTLVEIVSFCLGANAARGLGSEPLKDWSFTLDMNIGSSAVSVTRELNDSSKVLVEGNTERWPVQPNKERGTGNFVLKIADWTKVRTRSANCGLNRCSS